MDQFYLRSPFFSSVSEGVASDLLQEESMACAENRFSIDADAKMLITEDMQDGRTIEGLRLINPFAAANAGAIDALLGD